MTDNQWSAMLVVLKDKRKRKHFLREIFDAIFYMLKTGCQWHMLPKDFPKWQLVYFNGSLSFKWLYFPHTIVF